MGSILTIKKRKPTITKTKKEPMAMVRKNQLTLTMINKSLEGTPMVLTNGIHYKLLEVQKEIKGIKKTETNPYFKSKYFDVNAILAELKPILNKHGLLLMQPFSIDGNGKSVLKTIVMNTTFTSGSASELGNLISSEIYLPENIDPQKMGSAITYYRRYALQSMFALEAEDDDGNLASHDMPFPSAKMSDLKPKDHQKKIIDVAKDEAERDISD